jgi:chromosome segregation ATPase
MSDPTENPAGLVKILDALQQLGAKFDEFRSEFDEFQPRILGLVQAKSDELRSELLKTRAEIMGRIDRLQGTVELVREDARLNWATADTTINRTRNSREDIDDLQKQIAAMQRRYQTLEALVEELRKSEDKKPRGL